MLRVQVVAVLDEKQSEEGIKQDLTTIANSISSSKGKNPLKFTTGLDINKTITRISENLTKNILPKINNEKVFKIVGALDTEKTLNSINKALSEIIGNIELNVDSSQSKISTNANTSKPVFKQMSTSSKGKYPNIPYSKEPLKNLKLQFNKDDEVSTTWFKKADGELSSFIITIRKANGEIEKLNYSLVEKRDGNKFFEFKGSSGDDSGILKLQKNIDATKAKAKEMLSALDNTSRGVAKGTDIYKTVSESIDTITNLKDVEDFNNNFKKLKALVNDIYSHARMGDSLNPIQNLQDDLSKANVSVDDLQSSLSQLKIRSAENKDETFLADLSAIETKVEAISKSFNEVKNINFSEITDSNKLINAVDTVRDFLHNIKETKTQITSLGRTNSAFMSNVNAKNQSEVLKLDKQKLSNRIVTWMNNNTRAAKEYGDKLRELQNRIDSVTSKKELSLLNSEFRKIASEASAEGLLGDSFFGSLKNNIAKFTQWFTIGGFVSSVVRTVKDMAVNVSNLDKEMVELKKVTNETDYAYDKFLESSIEKAKELGTTITDIVSATSSFSRLGYSLEDASELGKVATMYANVGDEIESVEDASNSIISTIKAFDIDASNSMSIIDKINNVANKEAISAGGLGEALQRSASALATANNNLDESLALITAGNLVSQDPASVGTGIKTMTLRIRGAKSELESLGEDTEGMIESTAKLQEKLKAVTGVDILEEDGETFKSTYRILEEISGAWKSLSDIERAGVLEDLFGKRQANIGASILDNFDVAAKTLRESINSEGSATREYEKWLTSVEAKQAQFKASFEELSNTIVSSDWLKTAIELGTAFLDILNDTNAGLAIMPTLLATIMTKANVGRPDTVECVRWFYNFNMPTAM